MSRKGMSLMVKSRVLDYLYSRFPDWIGASEILEALIVYNDECEERTGTHHIPTRGELRWFLGRSDLLDKDDSSPRRYRVKL